MSPVKVAIVGAGSFVFGPSMLHQAITENQLTGLELALVDTDETMCKLMAGVGRRMAHNAGRTVQITMHTNREAAFDGAQFVICVAARQLLKRFAMDAQIIAQYAPGHILTEFGGIAGISASLRQMALLDDIAADMQHYCPEAWLLNVSNPLPRVCQAASQRNIKTVGFCSVALDAYNMVGRIFGGEPELYPFTAARERWSITTAGLNHFTWLITLWDRATNSHANAALLQRLSAGATSGNPVSEALARETGFLLIPNDGHTADFLRPSATTRSLEVPSHGSTDDRQQRVEVLAAVGAGETPIEVLLDHAAWERPFDLIGALAYDKPADFQSLNLINAGQMPDLPMDVFVETPCSASAAGIMPHSITLPPTVAPLCKRTALVTDTIVQAFEHRSRAIVHEAVELDPTVLDITAGIAAIDACLHAHADVLPAFT